MDSAAYSQVLCGTWILTHCLNASVRIKYAFPKFLLILLVLQSFLFSIHIYPHIPQKSKRKLQNRIVYSRFILRKRNVSTLHNQTSRVILVHSGDDLFHSVLKGVLFCPCLVFCFQSGCVGQWAGPIPIIMNFVTIQYINIQIMAFGSSITWELVRNVKFLTPHPQTT